MLSKTHYANGQEVYRLEDGRLTYFFKNGTLKAQGGFTGGMMQGEWTFYRETGQLWHIGNFRDSLKHGAWTSYGRDGNVESEDTFENGKKLKK